MKRGMVAAVALIVLSLSTWTGASVARGSSPHPTRVLIVLFDQMVPQYADQFNMPNFRELRDAGTNFKNAYLGYMGSETVISHNVIVSGQLPKHMGWVDEAYRDTGNALLGGDARSPMQITGDLSLANFGTLVNAAGLSQARGLSPQHAGRQVHHRR